MRTQGCVAIRSLPWATYCRPYGPERDLKKGAVPCKTSSWLYAFTLLSEGAPPKMDSLDNSPKFSMRTHTAETQATMTPEKALQYLKEGNERFLSNLKANRDLLKQVNDTSEGQFPFAVILSCIDSRVSAELIFDQGLGDIFSIRIAGNILDDEILGCMEFACKVSGSKLILVLGHTRCGAVSAACQGTGDGYIQTLLDHIQPSVRAATEAHPEADHEDKDFIDEVAEHHVKRTIDEIREKSSTLRRMEANGQIAIMGAMYSVGLGSVEWFS